MGLIIIDTASAHGQTAVAIPSGSKFAYITIFAGANIGYILVSTTKSDSYHVTKSSSSSIKDLSLEVMANNKIGYSNETVDSDRFCFVFLG